MVECNFFCWFYVHQICPPRNETRSIAGNQVLTTELKRKLATVKSKKADVSSVSPSSEQLQMDMS